MSQTSKKWLKRLRPILASIIILSWLVVELLYGTVEPTLELRIMLIASLVFMFGESVHDAIGIIRGNKE